MRPTRAPAISRPARPHSTIVPAPSTQDHTMWTVGVAACPGQTSDGIVSQSM